MTNEERTKATLEKARRLVALLEDPHPGLSTWMMAVAKACDGVAEHAPSFERRGFKPPTRGEVEVLTAAWELVAFMAAERDLPVLLETEHGIVSVMSVRYGKHERPGVERAFVISSVKP